MTNSSSYITWYLFREALLAFDNRRSALDVKGKEGDYVERKATGVTLKSQ